MNEAREGAGERGRAMPFAGRRAGILLHPTSLPGGGLGAEACNFVDFLAAAGQSVWQTLPLGPPHDGLSPYQCLSVFAGNPALIDVRQLVDEGWLEGDAALEEGGVSGGAHRRLVTRAYAGFGRHATEEWSRAFAEFKRQHRYWLDDYSLYQVLRAAYGQSSWLDWPPPVRDRDEAALADVRARLADALDGVCFEQFVFHRQWQALKRYANERGVLLFGDLPIFVAHDSAEVWAHRRNFTLDARGRAQTVAGVPPDYFSATGQYWGNPHYRWDLMERNGFDWWRRRIAHQLELFDLLRIDHFRGFEAYWEIPAQAQTAMEGRWVGAPGDALFRSLEEAFDRLPLVAEDLGVITPEVERLRHKYGLPGMKVLQFAFGGGPDNPYLPHNHARDYVVYTGTHDNNTTVGWFDSLEPELRQQVLEYLGWPTEPMPWPLIYAAYASVAGLAIVPMQDVLGLGEACRMNTPGVANGNWRWSFRWRQVPQDLAPRLRRLAELYGRVG